MKKFTCSICNKERDIEEYHGNTQRVLKRGQIPKTGITCKFCKKPKGDRRKQWKINKYGNTLFKDSFIYKAF